MIKTINPMADGSCFVLVPLLLTCVFHAAGSRVVSQIVRQIPNSEVEDVLSKLPITIPEGFDPKNVNITTIHIKTCTGMKEQLVLLDKQLRQAFLHNSQLDREAIGLRRDVRLLKAQLAACSSAGSAVTGSHQALLLDKMRELLDTADNDAFLILKTMALSREVKSLEDKVKLLNSTESATVVVELQRLIQEKTRELYEKRQQIERNPTNSTIILQIISLQNQIFDVQQKGPWTGETGLQSERRIQDLQKQLNLKLRLLQGSGSPSLLMLELISVQSEITTIQKMISVHTEDFRAKAAQIQRQWSQRMDLLQRKIMQLNREKHNAELTKEILRLQSEVDQFAALMANINKTSDLKITELRALLEQAKKRQRVLEQQLEEADDVHAQLIIKIIGIMEEVKDHAASTGQATTLAALLQTIKKEYAKAQTDIKDLQRRLQLTTAKCSGLERTYEDVKTEFERKIADLNQTEDSEAALVLYVIHLQAEIKALIKQISSSTDPERISELQKKIKIIEDKLKTRTEDIERLIPSPTIILTIIERFNELLDLQDKTGNMTSLEDVEDYLDGLDGLLTEIHSDDGQHIVVKILMLQSQVDYLQRLLSDYSNTSQPGYSRTELTGKLKDSREELQKYLTQLSGKNRTNSRLILTVTDIYSQLKRLEREKPADNSSTKGLTTEDDILVADLKQELERTKAEHSRSLAEIQKLQKKLQLQTKECSGLEEIYERAKTEFELKIAELNKTDDWKVALILNVINLHDEIVALTNEVSTSEDRETITELRKQLAKKQEELNSKTEDIERLIPNPNITKIIELQKEILVLQSEDTNGTAGSYIIVLQSQLDNLIGELGDRRHKNIKLMLKILTLQSQVKHLQRLLSNSQTLASGRITQLTNDLRSTMKELEGNVSELKKKNKDNADLILSITNLQIQLRELEKEKETEGQTSAATISRLRKQLSIKVEEYSRDQVVIQELREKLNQTESECSDSEHKIKDLQTSLDAKLGELQSKSDTITSLTLQISTLNVQVEGLKKQLQNTVSKSKVDELQKLLDEKNAELEQKTQELKERSAQPQRFLQIIAIQTEIEKLVTAAANESDFAKLEALQAHLKELIGGIQDEKDENTKLMFTILAQRDEIAGLKKQESQLKADEEKIKALEKEVEDYRKEIKKKKSLLDLRDAKIAELTAQIRALNGKIRPLEEEISDLKETYAETLAEVQGKLNLTKRQLQDSELQLKNADAKNFNLIMEITDLRAQVKKAKKEGTKAARKTISDLEQQLQAQQTESEKLESRAKALEQEVSKLKTCCTDSNTQCQDLQSQLQQKQQDAGRLQQQLAKKDADLEQLQREVEEQTRENKKLQDRFTNLQRQLIQNMDTNDELQQQLRDKDVKINELEQELQNQTGENYQLQDDYNNLHNEKIQLEEKIQDLQKKLEEKSNADDETIHATKMTLDPDTAHPRIILSAGNTEISTTDDIQGVPDSPGRFDVTLGVLGATGYLSGRHYWEVSVAGKNCFHVGMASESAPRKGSLSFKPVNGYWTILLNKQGQYKALDRRPVTIQTVTQPVTLGILLDYKKGQVSFYDASARAHLYSFRGQKFTDRIYPFVNFCVEVNNLRPLILLPPGSVDWIK
ncbi:centromere-associated protein E [Mugil cephalus]|uniref:centromere-associated protein E n=1 Tax=Mugil cephalus TaxID=48193 RepID=UPI001FB61EA3|nr:centromere-associated protein E [Mugil cephalus]